MRKALAEKCHRNTLADKAENPFSQGESVRTENHQKKDLALSLNPFSQGESVRTELDEYSQQFTLS
ncbi:hypothetical protein [Dickeya zeae]|uniref:hypothetical protein n=1 Tax=Dickeya zeae TaxID=204042 RepID=UPI001F453AFF|nr:hypothetical protein [Dickeya zeae]UJR60851.1 hypothetical protein HJ586_00625 [Dickeya zeae]